MFKKLFIGLIILSALSSEGAVLLQGNYSDLLLCIQIESGIFSENSIPSALNAGAENNGSALVYNKLSCDALKLESDKERYKYKNWFKNFSGEYFDERLLPSFSKPYGAYTYILNREPVIEGTDPSPPNL